MSDRTFATFEEFWDFYVGEHKKPATRWFHFLGLTAAGGCVVGSVLFKKRWLLLAAPVCGYAPAWFSHFFIEKNKPASFKYPLWSFQADFKMWWKMATGEMQAEVDRVVRQEEEAASASVDGASPPSREAVVN